MVVNTRITVKNQDLYKKLRLLSNKSMFKIVECTQHDKLTINEVVGKVKISKAKIEFYLSNLYKTGLIEKSRDGKFVRIKSKINLSKLSKTL